MASRGNEPATIAVRPHLALGAVLVALAALSGLLWAGGFARASPNLHLMLGLMGLTLLAHGIAYWYLPSFAKRAVIPSGIAAYAGPLLFGISAATATVAILAGLADLLRTATVALGLALVLFPLVLVATVVAGPQWRGGTPFWRAGGHHERGDRVALAAFAASAAWFAVTGWLLLFSRTPGIAFVAVAWLLALALFVVGGLAHLAPRSAGVPLPWLATAAGLALANAGGLVLMAPLVTTASPDPLVPSLLLAGGFGLVASSLADRRGAKSAGPRWREARIPLTAALVALALGAFLLVAGFGVRPGWATLAFYAHLVALLLGMEGLTLLTLPVLFNQRPAPRFLLPGAIAALAGLVLVLAAAFAPVPRLAGALGLAAAVALWLAAMWPLRKPRRECPP